MLKVDFKILKGGRNKTQLLDLSSLEIKTLDQIHAVCMNPVCVGLLTSFTWRQHEKYSSTGTGMSDSLPLTLE